MPPSATRTLAMLVLPVAELAKPPGDARSRNLQSIEHLHDPSCCALGGKHRRLLSALDLSHSPQCSWLSNIRQLPPNKHLSPPCIHGHPMRYVCPAMRPTH